MRQRLRRIRIQIRQQRAIRKRNSEVVFTWTETPTPLDIIVGDVIERWFEL
jgi:hypothetical protein